MHLSNLIMDPLINRGQKIDHTGIIFEVHRTIFHQVYKRYSPNSRTSCCRSLSSIKLTVVIS